MGVMQEGVKNMFGTVAGWDVKLRVVDVNAPGELDSEAALSVTQKFREVGVAATSFHG